MVSDDVLDLREEDDKSNQAPEQMWCVNSSWGENKEQGIGFLAELILRFGFFVFHLCFRRWSFYSLDGFGTKGLLCH